VWRALAFGGCFCPYRGGSRAATRAIIMQEIELDEESQAFIFGGLQRQGRRDEGWVLEGHVISSTACAWCPKCFYSKCCDCPGVHKHFCFCFVFRKLSA